MPSQLLKKWIPILTLLYLGGYVHLAAESAFALQQ
jgi:hypothetical protein